MGATRHCVFRVFFNCNRREKSKAESTREESLAHLTGLFEKVARFACIAKDENEDEPSSMLKGHANLKSPCAQAHFERWLGRHCTCCHSNFGDMTNLCRPVCIDKQLATVGNVSAGNSNSKTFTEDPKFVVKLLVDSTEGRDIEHQKDNNNNRTKNAQTHGQRMGMHDMATQQCHWAHMTWQDMAHGTTHGRTQQH